jgi:hypothetical protein
MEVGTTITLIAWWEVVIGLCLSMFMFLVVNRSPFLVEDYWVGKL